MKNWDTFTLGDIVTIKHGWAFKGEYFSEEPTNDILLTPGNFYIGGGFKSDKLKFYNGKFPQEYLLQEGDVIVTMTDLSKEGDTLGFSAKVPRGTKKNYLHNQRIGLVKLKTKDFDLGFIYWLLRTSTYQEYIAASASGATVRHTSPAKIYSYKFKAPKDKSIQTKIASILSVYDDLIENNLRRIKLLEETARITYEEWFVRFTVNGKKLKVKEKMPAGWRVDKIGAVCNASGGGTPAKANAEYWDGGKITWFSPTDLSKSNSIFQIDSANKITEEGLSNSSAKLLQPNSFMISSRATIGLFGITDRPFSTNQGFINITPHKEYHKEFLFYNFLSRVEEFKGYATGSTFPELSKSKFKGLDIVFPDESTLIEFHKVISPIHKLIGTLSHQNGRLKEARDILLPRLMSGAIDLSTEWKTEGKVIPIEKGKQREANWEFKEAVLIAMLTEKFGTKQFPLGRKRYTKFSYLFHRHVDNQIQHYKRKAAGPYNPKTKYQGPEKIAHENGYVDDYQNGNLTGFIPGKNISTAKTYFEKYWSVEHLTWLEGNFRFKKNDDLELYATVDNALLELFRNDKSISVEAVKTIIRTEKEWKAKLERDIFSDANIQKAIDYLLTIFQYL